jgi:AbrB family looped-hinge helix DNA binding protein
MEVTLDKTGRLVIPKKIREQAGLTAGTRVDVSYRRGTIEIEPVAAEVTIVQKNGFSSAQFPGAPPIEQETVNRIISEIREPPV